MLILLCLPHGAYAQCPFAVSLHATGNCTGDTISIRTDFTLIQIVWFRNGVIDKTIINSPGDTLYNPAQAGSYSVIVSAENGCTMTIGPVVIAALDPTNSFPVSISSSTTSVCSGNPITFMVTTPSDASGLIYRWQMNNMPVAGSDQRYTVSGLSGGDVVSCLAINSSTCAAGTSNSIIMTADDCKDSILAPIHVPNAFTPNGDGRNELFYVLSGPVGSQIKEFSVFNRWGQKLFGCSDAPPGDPAFGWNGYYKGAAAPPGAYVYRINLRLADGSSRAYRGTVLLIR